ncbi:50S ribosomal protein L22 [Candidatus Woesebacteria bacterium]|nr:MAG: 50S ribosomal protein L22 [Candidatus Woesebacteria bacterium]
MQVFHTQKFVRTSPRKLRLVADVVRNLEPNRAVELLPFVGKRASIILQKSIKTAIANAKDQGVTGELVIKELQINEATRLKRGRAVSRGRWHPYQRKMSHIRIVLEQVEKKTIDKVKAVDNKIAEKIDKKSSKQVVQKVKPEEAQKKSKNK